jgi:hypothetical protein
MHDHLAWMPSLANLSRYCARLLELLLVTKKSRLPLALHAFFFVSTVDRCRYDNDNCCVVSMNVS